MSEMLLNVLTKDEDILHISKGKRKTSKYLIY